MDWIEKIKQNSEVDIVMLEAKINEVNEVFNPIIDACRASTSRLG